MSHNDKEKRIWRVKGNERNEGGVKEERNGAKGSERNKRNEKDQVGMKKNEKNGGDEMEQRGIKK
uniref:Uncharacterized protein n=1 Tax=Rhizophagus irregularis (strain DAOM 181602 / DAOM 197198 / MUCL 43194) TaxID=747089 RepID=U9U4A3_RHIID